MAEAILFGLATEILKNLGSTALDEIASAWGFKDSLEKLKKTITTIRDGLLDAEDRQADNHIIRGWLERLAAVVYEADDLFDEVATVASQKQLMGGNKLIKEVHTFFSRSNQIAFPIGISRKIKTIRKKLDDIVKDSTDFKFMNRPLEGWGVVSTIRGRAQTFSYVDSEDVIGRGDDKKAILDLLASNDTKFEVLSVISIVGIGGQGKTTLAQLLYNDPWVQGFFELNLWVCVSEDFNIKEITEKILRSATKTETPKLEMEQLQGMLRNELGDKKYLLVLDDVWNENRDEWLKLESLLKVGREGSKILVTTRSREVANVMGTDSSRYELEGLLEDESWELFQKMAFKPGQHQENPHLMMEIGKEIVQKCANVPLAIRTLGSLLYGKDESQWSLLKNTSLNTQNGIMDILKLSYQHLPSPMKNCFAYCALFPRDYEFNKETLIDLWMAEGFIIPKNDESQGVEDVAEGYFQFLLQRCFFQNMMTDKWGVISCKMHDLMHDLAQQVAAPKCLVVKSTDSNNNNKGIHHLSFAYRLTSLSWMLNLKRLRTFLMPMQIDDGSPFNELICQKLMSSFRSLRVLNLHDVGMKSLPSSIGKLIHLRYLNLSRTPIRELPDAITKLQNLQTLNLYCCKRLRTFPKKMKKLNNLRSLDVGECFDIIHMPPGFGELTSLIKLPRFIVDHNNKHSPGYKNTPKSAKLSDLGTLNNLRGRLHIIILGEIRNPLVEATQANLNAKHGLTELHIEMNTWAYYEYSGINHDEAVLEGLKPHCNLKKLEISWYGGQKLPSWFMNNLCTNLPKLVKVGLLRCDGCHQIPSFGHLPFLKNLHLEKLPCVEYMEMESDDIDDQSFFPSLEQLTLKDMDILEGWWKVKANVNVAAKDESHHITEQWQLNKSFSKLSKLWIQGCPKLKLLPPCPNVEDLRLVDVNETITVSRMAASTSTSRSGSELKKLTISNMEELISLPKECLHQLSQVDVQDENLVSTDGIRVDEVFKSLSSLHTLQFTHCHSLSSFGQGLGHLTALEKLVLWRSKQLDLSLDEQLPWKNLKNLRHLKIEWIPKLVSLPSGFQHLTNLHSLVIRYSDELKELPEWISCFSSLAYLQLAYCPQLKALPDGFRKLTSLNHMSIVGCQQLTERCRAPNGKDWPKIQHIPFVYIEKDLRLRSFPLQV